MFLWKVQQEGGEGEVWVMGWWRGCGSLRRGTGATAPSGRLPGSTLSAWRTAVTVRTSSSSCPRGLLTWTHTPSGRTSPASCPATGGKYYSSFGTLNCFGNLVTVGGVTVVEFWKVFWRCLPALADWLQGVVVCIKESASSSSKQGGSTAASWNHVKVGFAPVCRNIDISKREHHSTRFDEHQDTLSAMWRSSRFANSGLFVTPAAVGTKCQISIKTSFVFYRQGGTLHRACGTRTIWQQLAQTSQKKPTSQTFTVSCKLPQQFLLPAKCQLPQKITNQVPIQKMFLRKKDILVLQNIEICSTTVNGSSKQKRWQWIISGAPPTTPSTHRTAGKVWSWPRTVTGSSWRGPQTTARPSG